MFYHVFTINLFYTDFLYFYILYKIFTPYKYHLHIFKNLLIIINKYLWGLALLNPYEILIKYFKFTATPFYLSL